jgi:hypothetical protein
MKLQEKYEETSRNEEMREGEERKGTRNPSFQNQDVHWKQEWIP